MCRRPSLSLLVLTGLVALPNHPARSAAPASAPRAAPRDAPANPATSAAPAASGADADAPRSPPRAAPRDASAAPAAAGDAAQGRARKAPAPSREAKGHPSSRPSTRGTKQGGWFHPSYWLDWGATLALAGVALGLQYSPAVYQRAVDPEDRSTSLPRRSDTVPNWTLAFTAGVPLTVIGLAQIGDPSWHDVHHASLAMAEAFVLTLLTTVALKRAVGRLRPDFLERCQPDASGVCTGDPDDILEGRQSFPSGHTSLSFAGGTFLTLYLWGKLQPFRTGGALWKLLVILAPMAVATAVGVTRISDHRHHWEDVLGGGIIGFGYAMLSYRLHYGWPWSQDGGTPTRRRRWAAFPVVGTGHLGVVAQGRF